MGGGNRGAMMSPNFGPGGGVNQQVPPTPYGWGPDQMPGMRGARTPGELVDTGSIPAPTNIPQARFPEPLPGGGGGGGGFGEWLTGPWAQLGAGALAGVGQYMGTRQAAKSQEQIAADALAFQKHKFDTESGWIDERDESMRRATPMLWTGQTRR